VLPIGTDSASAGPGTRLLRRFQPSQPHDRGARGRAPNTLAHAAKTVVLVGFDPADARVPEVLGRDWPRWRSPRVIAYRVRVSLELFSFIVDDYDAAIAFFTETLRFVVAEDAPAATTDGRAKRWVVVRPADGGPGLLIARADGLEQTATVGNQFAGRVGLSLRVDDFDETLIRLKRAGCALVRAPRSEPYGTVCVFRDPWGNLWDLLGAPTTTTAR
jgi:catechol 2,3-dioxygenase-like lactoylglutathione lyase family enzyme